MSITTYNKLVRDNIPQIIERSGKKAHIKELSVNEYKRELKWKLIEEAQELLEAETEEQMMEELADIAEVWEAMFEAFGIYKDATKRIHSEKRAEKGGFKKKYFLLCVEDHAEE